MADLNPPGKDNPAVFTGIVRMRSRFRATTSMPAADESDSQSARRVLSLIPASSIVVASMVGTGIFTTTGLMIQMGAGGGDVLLAWLLGGVVALCGALCYGEIGANLPRSGGEYFYLSRLLHPALGVMSGWVSLVVGFAAPIAASAMAMHLYLARIVPHWPVRSMAVLTIILLSVLHSFDVRLGGKVQSNLIAVQVILLLAFIAGSLFRSNHVASFTQFNPSFWSSSAFAVVLIFVSFAYSGWNAAAYVGGEIRNPERTLPRSLIVGASAVGVLYVLVNVSYLSAVPAAELSGVKEVAHDVGQRLWGTTGGNLTSALIALTLISPVSAMIMIGPRVLEAMSADGFMPRSFSKLNRRRVPATAVFVQAALAAVIVVTSSFGPLLIYIGFTLTIFAALTVLSLFRLRRQPDIKKICVGYPLTPIIFLAFALWATVWSIRAQPIPALAVLATLFVGYLAYAFREIKLRMENSSPTVDLAIYTDKIGESGREIIRQAYDEARSLNARQLTSQHALIAIATIRPLQFDALMQGLGLEREPVLQAFAGQPNDGTEPVAGIKVSDDLRALLQEALKHARENGRRLIEYEDILFALFIDKSSAVVKTFARLGVDQEELLRQLKRLKDED